MEPNLSGQVIIVTGANAGIGKVTARELAKMGATVVMVCRSQPRGAAALAEVKQASGSDDIHLMLCDLSSQASIRQFVSQFRAEYDRLDVLVNNAGAYFNDRQVSADGYELTLALNHMGYFLLTDLLLDMLQASAPARIVNVSSGAHRRNKIDWDDLQRTDSYSGFGVYSESKLMNILFTNALARRLEGSGVTVNSLHPGFVRTNFGRNNNGLLGRLLMPLVQLMAIDEDKGAETTIYLASSPAVADVTGRYFEKKKAVKASSLAYDEAAQERLWAISESLVLTPEMA
jgi:NAD(P)-dependent dehydrogenase (short-subunit alcohol dehydrogenase family)